MLILNGNGADIAQHCIPSVPAKRYPFIWPLSLSKEKDWCPDIKNHSFCCSRLCRISITFRKMDDGKLPYKFSQDPELLGIRPLIYSPLNKSPVEHDEYGKRLWGSASKSKARRRIFWLFIHWLQLVWDIKTCYSTERVFLSFYSSVNYMWLLCNFLKY